MEKINNTNIFRINKDFNIPNNHQTTFQSTFSYLRKKLQVKYTRKTHIDSLLKKCKGKFFKAVHDSIKLCLNILFNRLPQKFITNITIDYNKKFLYKNLEDILSKNLCKKDKIDLVKEILNTDFYSLYETYTSSDRFKREINEIQALEGKRNGILYEFVASNFCIYYLYSKAHVPREKKKNSLEEEKEII